MRMRQWPQAFCALDEAIKLSRSNWKLWQNYLYTALSSDHVTAAVDAAENLLELQVQSRGFLLFVLSLHCLRCFMFCQGKDGVDVEVFDVLFKKLPAAAASMTSGGSSSLISRGVALLTRASGLCSDSVELWAIYADFMEKHARADAAAMLDIRLSAYRNCQKQGWASDAKAYPVVVGTGTFSGGLNILCCLVLNLVWIVLRCFKGLKDCFRAFASAGECVSAGRKVRF